MCLHCRPKRPEVDPRSYHRRPGFFVTRHKPAGPAQAGCKMRGEDPMKLAFAVFMTLAAAAPMPRGDADQIPTEFKNLQVLPKDISRADLVQTMRQVATDLGVRCTHCHVGPDNL